MSFFTGFAGQLGEEAQKHLDSINAEEADSRSQISKMHWATISNPEASDAEREYSISELEKLNRSPLAKSLFKHIRESMPIGKAVHEQVHGSAPGTPAPGTGSPGLPSPSPDLVSAGQLTGAEPSNLPAQLDVSKTPIAGGLPAPSPELQAQAATSTPAPAPEAAAAQSPNMSDIFRRNAPSAVSKAMTEVNATFAGREEMARRIGLAPKPGEQPSIQYQRFMATGQIPIGTTLTLLSEDVTGDKLSPDAIGSDGRLIPASDRVATNHFRVQHDPYQDVMIATPHTTSSVSTPTLIGYKGPSGEHLPGFKVGTKLFDQQMNPLPDGTVMFDASLAPMTTVTRSTKIANDKEGNVVGIPTTNVTERGPTAGGLTPPPAPPAVTPPAGGGELLASATPPSSLPAAPSPIAQKVQQAAQAQGVDPALAMGVASAESSFNQDAKSPKGALGVMQLMPDTAKGLGVDPTNEDENIKGGVQYLGQLIKQFGNPAIALAAYNWGPDNVQNAIDKYGPKWFEHTPDETKDYVTKIITGAGVQGGGAGAGASGGAGTPKAGVGQAEPVLGPDGKPLHKPLSAPAKLAVGQVTNSLDLLDQIMPDLAEIAADKDKNKLWDSVKQRSAWQQYTKLGIDPSSVSPDSIVAMLPNVDPRLAKLLPTIAMLQVVAAQPWLRNIRRFEFLQQVQQHLPNPEQDTPENMLNKLDSMSINLPNLMRAAYEEEGITPDPFKPAKVKDIQDYAAQHSGMSYADAAHIFRNKGYRITRE